LTAERDILVVGSIDVFAARYGRTSSPGVAYVYTFNGSEHIHTQTIEAPAGTDNGYLFGGDLDLSNNTLLIGGEGRIANLFGGVFVYTLNPLAGQFDYQTSLIPNGVIEAGQDGAGVRVEYDSGILATSAYIYDNNGLEGAIYVYTKNANDWNGPQQVPQSVG
jgi:hypothetical protein